MTRNTLLLQNFTRWGVYRCRIKVSQSKRQTSRSVSSRQTGRWTSIIAMDNQYHHTSNHR